MERQDILRQASACVTGKRSGDYGKAEDNFAAIARLWEAYLPERCISGEVYDLDITAEDVAVMMTLFKIGRIATGNVNIDNYVDAAGYMACAGEIASNYGGTANDSGDA